MEKKITSTNPEQKMEADSFWIWTKKVKTEKQKQKNCESLANAREFVGLWESVGPRPAEQSMAFFFFLRLMGKGMWATGAYLIRFQRDEWED